MMLVEFSVDLGEQATYNNRQNVNWGPVQVSGGYQHKFLELFGNDDISE